MRRIDGELGVHKEFKDNARIASPIDVNFVVSSSKTKRRGEVVRSCTEGGLSKKIDATRRTKMASHGFCFVRVILRFHARTSVSNTRLIESTSKRK